MIKKKLFKFTSCLMCAAMIACSFTACGTRDTAVASAIEQSAGTDTDAVISQAFASFGASGSSNVKTSTSATTNKKEETVYVFTDVSGKQDHVVVNEKLKNVTKLPSISDVSSLKNIQNVSGDEAFTNGSGDALTWAADGGSLTYQGITDKAAPVTIKVTYKLDGKEIKGEDLAGKSGKVTIRYDYTNNEKQTVTVNGQSKTMCVPFAVVTGLALDTEKFSNITVTNGKLVESDKSTLAVGFALPGLKSTLSTISLGGSQMKVDDIPEYFEVTADVKNFELDMAMSMASSNLFSDVNLDDINVDKFKDQANELQDGSNKLMDGSSQLADATNTLKDGAGQVADGTSQLFAKVPTLTGGIDQLDGGAGQLVTGTSQLFAKIPVLTGAIGQLAAGSDQLVAGIGTDKDSYSAGQETVYGAVNDLDAGAGQLAEGAEKLQTEGMVSLADGAQAVKDGTAQLKQGIIDSMKASIKEINDNASTYGADYQAAMESAKSLETLGTAASAEVQTLQGALGNKVDLSITPATDMAKLDSATVEKNLTKYISGYTAIVQARDASAANAQLKAVLDNAEVKFKANGMTLEQAYLGEIKALVSASGNGGVYQALTTVANTMGSEESMNKLTGGFDQLTAGEDKLIAGIGSADDSYAKGDTSVYGAVNDIKAGAATLKAGTTALKTNGILSLSKGALALQDGLYQLSGQTPALAEGVGALKDGATALRSGTTSLKDGAGVLADGVKTLNDGATQLASGAIQINEGAVTLKDGMIQFNDEGISKITSLVGSDADTAIDTIKKLVELGKNYQSFAGKSENVEGTVKFIYKTASIESK